MTLRLIFRVILMVSKLTRSFIWISCRTHQTWLMQCVTLSRRKTSRLRIHHQRSTWMFQGVNLMRLTLVKVLKKTRSELVLEAMYSKRTRVSNHCIRMRGEWALNTILEPKLSLCLIIIQKMNKFERIWWIQIISNIMLVNRKLTITVKVNLIWGFKL